jgi:hypothetical protein
MTMNEGQFWGLVLLASPILFAVAMVQRPVAALMFFGVILMYGAAVVAAFTPLLAIATAAVLFTGGLLLVAMGGALKAILKAIDDASAPLPPPARRPSAGE